MAGHGSHLYGVAEFRNGAEFTRAMQTRLLIPPVSPTHPVGAGILPCACGKVIDFTTDCFHWVECVRSEFYFTKRHNAIRDLLIWEINAHLGPKSGNPFQAESEPLIPTTHTVITPAATSSTTAAPDNAEHSLPDIFNPAATAAAAAESSSSTDGIIPDASSSSHINHSLEGMQQVMLPSENMPDEAGLIGAHQTSPRAVRTRADVLVKNTVTQDYWFIDVAICSPSCASYRSQNNSHVDQGAASRRRERAKLSAYRSIAPALVAENKLVPVVIEATGALGAHANAFIHMLCGNQYDLRSSLIARIGAVIARYNARMSMTSWP
jgi:hypothetical protein